MRQAMSRMKIQTLIKWLPVVAALTMQGAFADGGVSFSRNRMVFPATEKAITLTVTNHGSGPYLVQAGVSGTPEGKGGAPFMVTPPMFRLEGKGENVMRILRTGGALPADRESVFYFYANTIPGQAGPAAAGGAVLSISMRTVLKLFWRPDGLKMKPDEAPEKLVFEATRDGVTVKNPTPYYQSFAQLQFDGHDEDLNRVPSMVAPFGELHIPLTKSVHRAVWSVMNDYGGVSATQRAAVREGSH